MEVQSPFQIVWEKTAGDTKFPEFLLQRISKHGNNLAMVRNDLFAISLFTAPEFERLIQMPLRDLLMCGTLVHWALWY
jgi:hypothetical protein